MSTQNKDALRLLIEKSVRQVVAKEQEEIITDFHIQAMPEEKKVRIYDDNDFLLASTELKELEELDDDEFTSFVAEALRQLLHNLSEEKVFDGLNIFRPFSFVLIDNEKETIEDLFVVDSDQIMASEVLMKGLDEDLDAFLRQLLEN